MAMMTVVRWAASLRWTAAAAGPAVVLGVALVHSACSPPARDAPGIRLDGYEPATPERLRAAGWRTEFPAGNPDPSLRIAMGPFPRNTAPAPVAAPAVRADAADLRDEDPVVVVRTEDGVRGWPLAPLLGREVLADTMDGVPVLVSYCSVCATVRVWDRRVDGDGLDLRVSGLLRDGNSLLYDAETESLWEQRTGRAIAGARDGRRLRAVPSFVVPFAALREDAPAAAVAQPRDPAPALPWRTLRAEDLAAGRPPDWFRADCADPLAMLVTWEDAGSHRTEPVAGDRVRHRGEAVLFRNPKCAAPYRFPDGTPGPLTGSVAVFRRVVGGRTLTFTEAGAAPEAAGAFRDRETGTLWNRLGEAVEGPLRGERLEILDSVPGLRASLPATE